MGVRLGGRLAIVVGVGMLMVVGSPVAASGAIAFDVTTTSTSAASGFASPLDVDIADFNGDGKLDLVTANISAETISVMLGNGSGAFQAPREAPLPPPDAIQGATSVAAGDFNADGRIDVAASHPSGTRIVIMLGDGAGGLTPSPATITTSGASGLLRATDLNGDGISDLVSGFGPATSSDTDQVTVYLGQPGGGLGPATGYSAGPGPAAFSFGDMNRDGRRDLVVGNATTGVSILLGDGLGGFAAPRSFATAAQTGRPVVADFNEDGLPDVAVTSFDGRLWVLLGDGSGSLGTPASYLTGTLTAGAAVADFDGDRHADVATISGPQGLEVFRGFGTGKLEQPTGLTSPLRGSITARDVNADGKVDLVGTGDFFASSMVILLNRSTPPPPPAVLSLRVGSINFGRTRVGRARLGILTVANTSTVDLRIAKVALGGAGSVFAIQVNGCRERVLRRAHGCRIVVRFRPARVGLRRAVIRVTGREAVTDRTTTGNGTLQGRGVRRLLR